MTEKTKGHAVFTPDGQLIANTISTESSRLEGGNAYQAIRSAVRMVNFRSYTDKGIKSLWASMEKQGFTVHGVLIIKGQDND